MASAPAPWRTPWGAPLQELFHDRLAEAALSTVTTTVDPLTLTMIHSP